MKNIRGITVKFLVFTCFIFNSTACGNFPQNAGVTGIWENTIKNSDGSNVVTSLDIKEVAETFIATMSAKVNGNESETLKLTTASIKLSGVINGNILSIIDIESDSDNTKTYSRLIVSKDRNLITLSPGEVKFRKKEH